MQVGLSEFTTLQVDDSVSQFCAVLLISRLWLCTLVLFVDVM